jgi:hypothetical protein
MGARGPKPVEVKELSFAAMRWAALLFGVRGGAAGVAERWGQKFEIGLISQYCEPQKIEETERLLRKMEEEGWEVAWPLWPSLKIWEELKNARSAMAVGKAIAALREWRRQNANLLASDDVLGKAEADPLILLRAMRLPNYPGDAKTNDDKRILFFSKVLAGLEFGHKPLTATKKLSGWRCENYWETVGVQYVASFKTGLPIYPGAHEINVSDSSIEFRDSRKHVEIVAERYATSDSLEKTEKWYFEELGEAFKRTSSGAQGAIKHGKLSIGPCDEALIANEDGLVWVAAMSKKKIHTEIGLARIGRAKGRRLWRKEKQR